MAGRDKCILQENRTAGRGALAETRPVVNNAESPIVALNKGDQGFSCSSVAETGTRWESRAPLE